MLQVADTVAGRLFAFRSLDKKSEFLGVDAGSPRTGCLISPDGVLLPPMPVTGIIAGAGILWESEGQEEVARCEKSELNWVQVGSLYCSMYDINAVGVVISVAMLR